MEASHGSPATNGGLLLVTCHQCRPPTGHLPPMEASHGSPASNGGLPLVTCHQCRPPTGHLPPMEASHGCTCHNATCHLPQCQNGRPLWLIQDLGWDSLSSRQSSARLTMFYKATKGDVAIPIDELATKPDTRTGRADYNYQHIRANKTKNLLIVKTRRRRRM